MFLWRWDSPRLDGEPAVLTWVPIGVSPQPPALHRATPKGGLTCASSSCILACMTKSRTPQTLHKQDFGVVTVLHCATTPLRGINNLFENYWEEDPRVSWHKKLWSQKHMGECRNIKHGRNTYLWTRLTQPSVVLKSLLDSNALKSASLHWKGCLLNQKQYNQVHTAPGAG